MTLSYSPRTSDMLTLTEMLELLDRMMGYGIDRYSREELCKLNDRSPMRHVIDTASAHRMVDTYINEEFARRNNGRRARTDRQRNSIIRMDDAGEDKVDVLYHRDDIVRMMEDPDVREELARHFKKRTTLMQDIYIPTVVAKTHPIDPVNRTEDEDWYR